MFGIIGRFLGYHQPVAPKLDPLVEALHEKIKNLKNGRTDVILQFQIDNNLSSEKVIEFCRIIHNNKQLKTKPGFGQTIKNLKNELSNKSPVMPAPTSASVQPVSQPSVPPPITSFLSPRTRKQFNGDKTSYITSLKHHISTHPQEKIRKAMLSQSMGTERNNEHFGWYVFPEPYLNGATVCAFPSDGHAVAFVKDSDCWDFYKEMVELGSTEHGAGGPDKDGIPAEDRRIFNGLSYLHNLNPQIEEKEREWIKIQAKKIFTNTTNDLLKGLYLSEPSFGIEEPEFKTDAIIDLDSSHDPGISPLAQMHPEEVLTFGNPFKRRENHENTMLRTIVRVFNNSKTETCNIHSAQFVKDSPLHYISQEKYDDASKLLLSQFQVKLQQTRDQNLKPLLSKWIQKITDDQQQSYPFLKAIQAGIEFCKDLSRLFCVDIEDKDVIAIMKHKADSRTPLTPNQRWKSYNFLISGPSLQLANPDGSPLEKPEEISLNSFCYPPFKTILNIPNLNIKILQQQVTAQFKLALRNLQVQIEMKNVNKGLFPVVAPGAFVRGLSNEQKIIVSQIINESLEQAKTDLEINKEQENIKFLFLGQAEKIEDLGGQDFGWGDIKSISPNSISQNEILSIYKDAIRKGYAMLIPIMGEPLGAVGNGASGDSAESAMDEFLTRLTGGIHAFWWNCNKNTDLFNKILVINH